jgi:phosphate transport system protein
MGKHLQFALADLESAITAEAEIAEDMVRAASRGLRERCLGAAGEVLSNETAINRSEVSIEEQCLDLLATHQPVAVDLRKVAAVLKINADLERIGDLALNLAERAESLVEFPGVPVPEELEVMVDCAIEMLRDARLAFVAMDQDLARDVCRRDDEVDGMNEQLIKGLVKKMADDPTQVPGYLHVFSASRIVERIADHATNIAEDVAYLVNGTISRHQEHLTA